MPFDQFRCRHKKDDQTLDHSYHVGGYICYTAHTERAHIHDSEEQCGKQYARRMVSAKDCDSDPCKTEGRRETFNKPVVFAKYLCDASQSRQAAA